jgi:glycosyltransferase involved in cell wall biosynthesis
LTARPDSDHLTIVVPVYRTTHLEDLLQDLYSQSDKRFSILLASDGPFDPFTETTRTLISNLGARVIENRSRVGAIDPTMSWSRAVSNVNSGWVWLVGDDDRVSIKCVEEFNRAKTVIPSGVNISRFPVRILTQSGLVGRTQDGPSRLISSGDFLRDRLLGQGLSFASEYIFRVSAFNELGGFVRFPFAWCSDDASWLRLSWPGGIWQISSPETEVLWREGRDNTSSKELSLKKEFSAAESSYISWLLDNFTDKIPIEKWRWRVLMSYWFSRKTFVKKYTLAESMSRVLDLGRRLRINNFEVVTIFAISWLNHMLSRQLEIVRKYFS